MAGFEDYRADTGEIEREIERKGIVLGIDWSDEVQVRTLAREAIDHLQADVKVVASGPVDYKLLATVDLFGRAGIMLRTMEASATVGIESHGGYAWKALAKALWAEADYRTARIST